MKLYLLRHGKADWPNWDRPDDERPLTKEGKAEMRRVADYLEKIGIKPTSILSSPLPRAWQTAEIAAEKLGREVEEEGALAKGFNVTRLRKMIARTGGRD